MKNVVLLTVLILSLVVNGILANRLLRTETSSERKREGGDDPVGRGSSMANVSAEAAGGSAPATGARKIHGVDWASLSAGKSLSDIIARMRQAGFPPLAVHAVGWAELTRIYGEKRLKIQPESEQLAYWKDDFRSAPEVFAKRAELARDFDRELQALLGPDWQRQNAFMAYAERARFGNLSQEKTIAVKQVIRDFDDLMLRVHVESQGALTREDREKLGFIEKERAADLAKVLTPAEFDEYMMINSNTARTLRRQLASFEPTEQEYRAIFRAQKAYDDKYSFLTGTASRTAEGNAERVAANKQLLAEVRAAIGNERAAEFERSRDFTYSGAAVIAQRLGLPKTVANDVYAVQQDMQRRVMEVRGNADLSVEQRTQQLKALQAEANNRVRGSLGEKGLDAYQGGGGQWLQYLFAPPNTTGQPGMFFVPR